MPPDKNPIDSQNGLFKALTRLFSGPIINYRSQSGRRIRRQHLDKFSSKDMLILIKWNILLKLLLV